MIKKLFIGILILLILFVGAAIAIPIIFNDQIIEKLKTSLNANVNAKVDFSDVDVSLLRSFPNLSLVLEDVEIIGKGLFEADTLAIIKRTSIDLNLMSVIRGETIGINSFTLTEPNLHLVVTESGFANWNILLEDSTSATKDEAPSNFKAELKSYEIINGKFIYDDASLNYFMQINGLNHTGNGDFTLDEFTLQTQSQIDELTVVYGGIPYLSKAKTKINTPVKINVPNMHFSFEENDIQLNELLLSFVGSIQLPNEEDVVFDVRFDAQKSAFKNFLSLVPVLYSKSFEGMQADGNFAFSGFAKGTYNDKSIPTFGVNLLVENGKIKYPGLPSSINNVQITTAITNPDGVPDNTLVDVSAFHAEFGKDPIDGKLRLSNPISDPSVDATLKGKLNLGDLTKMIPIEGIQLTGLLDANVSMKGKKSMIDKGQYDAFYSEGYVTANDINYRSEALVYPVSIPSGGLKFTSKNIQVASLFVNAGKSDFNVNGSIDNYLGYLFNRGVALKGKLDVKSGVIDVNELMGPSDPAEAAKIENTTLSVIEVPGNLDFQLFASAEKINYDNLELKNALGVVSIKDKEMLFRNFSVNTLDGRVIMDGSYSSKNPQKPVVNMNFGIEKMNIKKAFNAFNTVKLLAPIAQFTNGFFSTKMKFSTELDSDMMPVLSSISAEGLTDILQAIVDGFEPLNKLAGVLKNDRFKRIEVNNLAAKFKVENGRIRIDPFDIKKNDYSMTVQGFTGFDKSLDYLLAINIPRNALGTQTNAVVNDLAAKFSAASGIPAELGEMVKLNALVGGDISNPTIKIDLAEVKGAVNNALTAAFENKKTEIEDKINDEADKLKAAADNEVNRLKARADSIKKAEEARLKAIADSIKKAEEEKAKKKIINFIRPKSNDTTKNNN